MLENRQKIGFLFPSLLYATAADAAAVATGCCCFVVVKCRKLCILFNHQGFLNLRSFTIAPNFSANLKLTHILTFNFIKPTTK